MSSQRIIAAVEIGTSKTVVLIGEVQPGTALNIIGMSHCSSTGVRKGEIIDFKNVRDTLQAAFHRAEKSAGVKVDTVFLAQTGAHVEGFFHSGKVSVSSANNQVVRSDMQRARQDARARQLREGRLYIHHISNGFMLDDRPVLNPLNMEGRTLEAGYWSVHADERKLGDGVNVLKSIGLEVEDIILASLASAASVLRDEEKNNGVLLLDIGCGTTDFVLYKKGVVVATGVLAVGGDHLTNDLSMGLKISSKDAERLKLESGTVEWKQEDTEKVWLIGDQTIGDRLVYRRTLAQILEVRVEELFTIVRDQLGAAYSPRELGAGVVLTGGSAALRGIEVIAGRVFESGVRIGEGPAGMKADLRKPEFSTCLGLLQFALKSDEAEAEASQEEKGGVLGKVVRFFMPAD